MAGPASHQNDQDYHRGEMDISEQASTAALVSTILKWFCFHTALIIVFFTVWLRPGGDFMPALISTVVLAAAGFFLLRKKKTAAR